MELQFSAISFLLYGMTILIFDILSADFKAQHKCVLLIFA